METSSSIFSPGSALEKTYHNVNLWLTDHLPQILNVLILLIVGWILAYVFSLLAKKLLLALDSLLAKMNHSNSKSGYRIKNSYVLLTGRAIFILVFSFFLVACTKVLGISMFESWFNDLIALVPRMFSAVLVLIFGFTASNMAKMTLKNSQASEESSIIFRISRIVQPIIIFITVIFTFNILGIDVSFLTNAILVILALSLGSLALAMGLASKETLSNNLGSFHAKKQIKPGQFIKLGNIKGEILEITKTSIILETKKNQAIIPSKYFDEQICQIILDPEHENISDEISKTSTLSEKESIESKGKEYDT